ncbi:MAG: Trk family potassium uptake protein [Deltaproteobacteria bacterium]|nr:Trk family potassium uptake protein [Deltaproteobacteria bacterium]
MRERSSSPKEPPERAGGPPPSGGPPAERPALITSGWLLPLMVGGLVADLFFSPNRYAILAPGVTGTLFALAFAADWWWRAPAGRRFIRHVRDNWFDALLLGCVLLLAGERAWIIWLGLRDPGDDLSLDAAYRTYAVIFYVALMLKTFTGTSKARNFLHSLGRSPSAMTAFTFGVVILLGSFLLCLPQAVPSVGNISFIDALFISTSATCVTGLSTVDIGTWYTRFGHVVILLLVQAGGLGIITMSVLVPVLAGRRLEVRAESTLKEIMEADTLSGIAHNVKLIFVFTVVIEAAGAAILFADWSARGVIGGTLTRLFSAVFHAISAFCNAGFSLFSNNLEGFAGNWVTTFSIAGLIVVGGIGFPVLLNLAEWVRRRLSDKRQRFRLTFHSKVVLTITAGLIAAGTVLILALEWNNTLAPLSAPDKVAAAVFQSITPRTAGFNTVPTGSMATVTLFVIVVLMFIGASPQSTGGGIKTTSFAVIVLTVRALLRRREHVEAFRRTIPPAIIYRSSALVFIAMSLCAGSLCCLLYTEQAEFHQLLFEVVSAFGTVGLSTGVTPALSPLGKLVIIITMFVGRIGPLTLAVALAERPVAGRFRYPDDHVIIG